MTLQRLKAIATGILVLLVGGVLTTIMARTAWTDFDAASRQQEVVGTVIGQENTKVKVCRNSHRFATQSQCKDWQIAPCPLVQYQIHTGEVRHLKDCSLRLPNQTQVYVLYDRQIANMTRIHLVAGTHYHWMPLLLTSLQLAFGVWLLILGGTRFWQSCR